jgi:hypothetical protein
MVIFHSYAKITKRVVGKSSKPHLCRSNPHDVPSCSILYDSNRPQQSFFGHLSEINGINGYDKSRKKTVWNEFAIYCEKNMDMAFTLAFS